VSIISLCDEMTELDVQFHELGHTLFIHRCLCKLMQDIRLCSWEELSVLLTIVMPYKGPSTGENIKSNLKCKHNPLESEQPFWIPASVQSPYSCTHRHTDTHTHTHTHILSHNLFKSKIYNCPPYINFLIYWV
jgi:hypothetical protein